MHHPRPHHPLLTREFRYDSYEPQRNQYSFSHSATSGTKSFALPPRTPTHAEDSEMMVESPQYAYPPPSLAHPGNYGPPSAQFSPTAYQGFQSPPQSYESRPPPQSPTHALRPAQLNNIFSHIEHPPTSSVDPVASSDDDGGHRSRATTPHHPRRHMRAVSRPQHPYGYPAAYEYGPQESHNVDTRTQVDRGMSQTADPNPYALNRLPTAAEAKAPIGALRHRTRGRGGSESSTGSVVSSAAVVGDAIYRTDTLYDSMGARSNKQTSAQFQPQSAPATYPHDFSNGARPMEFQEQVPQVSQPMTPGAESPYIPPPSPQDAGGQGDHPFVYNGADWDYPLRSLRASTTASTDADAMSLDGRGQERCSSSRESSEDATGRSKKDKESAQALGPQATTNGEGKRKTMMACHFCRFRKLRCDGGTPCGHCEKRGKECTYDATIRRRGPGRKNKSAQETARVQLAQRQREEADRESKAQGPKIKAQRHESVVMAMPIEKRDASMQTLPQATRYPAASSQGDQYYAALNRYPPPSRHVGSPSGHNMSSPASQHMVPSATGVASAFSSPAGFQMQFRPPHDPPQRPQERQAFTIPFRHEPSTAPEVFPTSLAHQQQSQRYAPQQYGGSSHEQLAYGLQTPASTAPPSFYDSSPGRQSSSDQQRLYPYASSSYSQGQGQGQGYGSSRYQNDAHTDTESMYAYSEGANVMPSRYGGQMQVPPPPRSDVQAPYGREVYAGEDVGHVGQAGRTEAGKRAFPKMRR
ncbi:hypothetical protein FRC10_006868 [Ceratobasidium sp. 414]|nr:hypothetical protein FRC10_006868 [Ceratobasidium sp. 414]